MMPPPAIPAADSDQHVSADRPATAQPWKLGDIPVNRLGFGAMRLTQNGAAFAAGAAASDRDQAIATLRRAIELGVNHIDTAAFYFSALRSANELINTALAPYPDDLVIVTKVGPSRDAAGNWGDAARPEQLRGQVEENLRQLGRDHLDVVNYRRQASVHSISEHFGALAELRDAGLIREIGISGVGLEHLARGRRPLRRWCACRMPTALRSGGRSRTRAVAAPAASRASRSCRSSRSPGRAVVAAPALHGAIERRAHADRRRARRHRRPGQAGMDLASGTARAGHSRYRES